jgi:succinate dehydrogenase flavin-adding protein (antitoxin of CptAB toxin-antitoxin module)
MSLDIIPQFNTIMMDPDFLAILTAQELSDIETALENEDMDFLTTLAGNIVFDSMSLAEYVDHMRQLDEEREVMC